MFRSATLASLLLQPLLVACVQLQQHEEVTPVEKVTQLLKQIQTQVEAGGKKDAEQYDKYACFCKEQADEKQYRIEKSNKKLKKLAAKINKLDTEISTLNGDIKDLNKDITDLDKDIKDAQALRDLAHAKYLEQDKDAADAIEALEGAIKALKDSKGEMDGAKLDLVQLRQTADRVLKAVSGLLQVAPTKKQTTVLMQLSQDPVAYEYRSNDIIAVLEELADTFRQNKKELWEAEYESASAHEKQDLAMKNQKQFAEQDKAEKEKVVEQKTEERSADKEDETQETADRDADNDFLHNVLTKECKDKADLFDQRSSTRSAELTAIAEALDVLKKKVAPSYGANKKLVDLQTATGAKARGHWVWVKEQAASFLQLKGASSAEARAAATHKAAALLAGAATRLDSAALASAAARASASEDHFVKVRQIIQDLIDRLENDAAAEATQKSFCDTAMKKQVDNRDTAMASMEEHAATRAKLESEKATKEKEIRELADAIAELKRGLNEATELRDEEREENEKTIATAEEGKAGVELALKVLGEFYNNAFVQKKASYVPPNSDRDGNTVGDLRPDVFEEKYHGDQDSSKGIMGLLEVVLSDFERTIETVTEDEKDQQAAFDIFKNGVDKEVGEKSNEKTIKEARVRAIDDALTDNTVDMGDAKDLHRSAIDTLTDLKTQCVDGEETYAERVAKREKEIAALKQAHDILENWNN